MSKTNILIVEDDRDLREALCDTLGLAGYETLDASDGLAALAVLEKRKVGLVALPTVRQGAVAMREAFKVLERSGCGYAIVDAVADEDGSGGGEESVEADQGEATEERSPPRTHEP